MKNKNGNIELSQKEHYNKIYDDYSLHYGDQYSLKYRDEFINKYLAHGLILENHDTLDACCGNGELSRWLLGKKCIITGIDISINAIKNYKIKFPGCNAICSSILSPGVKDNVFDYIFIVGGLHHIYSYIHDVIDEIHRMLKHNGYFCFCEPHSGSFIDMARNVWYKYDEYFEKDERSIDIEDVENRHSHQFEIKSKVYGGNIGYLMILNSLIFRIPLSFKKYYFKPMFYLEKILSRFNNKALSCFVVCQWMKK